MMKTKTTICLSSNAANTADDLKTTRCHFHDDGCIQILLFLRNKKNSTDKHYNVLGISIKFQQSKPLMGELARCQIAHRKHATKFVIIQKSPIPPSHHQNIHLRTRVSDHARFVKITRDLSPVPCGREWRQNERRSGPRYHIQGAFWIRLSYL